LPKVSTIQWILSIFSLLLAASSYLLSTHDDLAMLALVLAALNVGLLAQVTVEIAGTRLVGKFILIASTIFYFWIGAISASRQDVPFSVPGNLSVFGRQFSIELVQLAFVYIALFQVALLIGYSIQPRLRKLVRITNTRLDSSSHNARAIRYVLAACALIPFLLRYDWDIANTIQVLVGGRSETSIEARDIGLLHFLLFFGMFGAALFLVEAFVVRSIGKIRNLFIGVITVLPFVLGGTRHLWLYLSLPTFIFIFRRLRGKLTLMRVLRISAIALVIVLVMQYQYAFRTFGWSDVETSSSENLTDVDVTGQFTALLFAEHLVPETHDYFMEPAEPYFIIHWIPRQFWPDKPIMQSWLYYNDAYVQGQAFNVTPSVIGQFHINWGIYGVIFIGIWLGFLASVADRLLLAINVEKQRAMAVVIGMFYAFIISSFRFYHPLYFAYLLFGIIAMWFVTRRNLAASEMSFEQPAGAAVQAALTPRF